MKLPGNKEQAGESVNATRKRQAFLASVGRERTWTRFDSIRSNWFYVVVGGTTRHTVWRNQMFRLSENERISARKDVKEFITYQLSKTK